MSLVILQCNTCPTTFTTDRNPEVGVHWSQQRTLLQQARDAGWTIEGENHRCAGCTRRAGSRSESGGSATPQVGWYWAQCCILDLERIDTDEQLQETIEQHEECAGDWWENLEDAIAAYREAMGASWGPDCEAAAASLRQTHTDSAG